MQTNVPENSLEKEYKMIIFYYEEENLEKQLKGYLKGTKVIKIRLLFTSLSSRMDLGSS